MSVQVKGSGTIGGIDEGLVVSGIVTATSLDVSGDIDVDGHTELDNVNIVGVTTITGDTGNVRLDLHSTASGTGSQIKLHNDHATAYFGQAGDTTGDLLVYNESNTNIRFFTNGNNERVRIDTTGSLHIASDGSRTQVSGNADDIIIGNTSTSNETGMTLFSTGASSFRFSDASGTDGAIEYGHSGRTLTFATSNANKMRISSPGASSTSGHAKVSVGALANSAYLNNSTNGDRSTLKVGNYLHLDSGGNGNFISGMSYNCWPSGNNSFYQGTVTANNADNRAAAVMMRYGRTEFWGDNSTTGYTAAQQITTMQANMYVHAAGYVTTPNTPSFYAFAMTGSSYDNGTMTGGTTSSQGHNIGNHYDTSTGIFTAPIAGRYLTGCGVLVESGSGRLEGNISKNNSTAVVNFNGTGTTYDGPTATIVVNLAANDTLRVKRQSGNAYDSGHGQHYFFAHLIG